MMKRRTYTLLPTYVLQLWVETKVHYIEVAQGAIFVEQKWRSGLVLGQLAVLKKKWADYEQLLRVVFSCFHGQKN